MKRTKNCLSKLERMNKTLRHEELDRVPISDFFWGSFVSRWKKELNLPTDASPYNYYDLDWIVTTPNKAKILFSNEKELVFKSVIKWEI